ncbi:MAG TPA: hypothetical protein VN968_14220 [Bradyrhizobium sp.]|nr:hypothetical protein [Bradyrhizobium sp.]
MEFSFVFFQSQQFSMPGVNEWLTIRNLRADSCKQLLIGRCDVRHGPRGAANWPGNGAVRKRQNRDNDAFEDIVIFPSQWGVLKDAAN